MRKVITFKLACQGLMFLMLGLAALSYSNKAKAEEFAFVSNEAGGEIVLTDQRGNCSKDWLVVLSRTGGGSLLSGCWSVSKGGKYIVVNWSDGDTSMYLLTDFTLFNDESFIEPAGVKL